MSIPTRCIVDTELDAAERRRVVRVFVGGRERNVVGDGAGAVDVVLVGSDGVGPAPVGEEFGGCVVVETTVPDEAGGGCGGCEC